MADTASADRGGFRGGFGGRGRGRGRGDRGRGRGRGGRGGRGKDEKEWIPVTKLGRLVKDGRIKSLEEIYLFSLPIKVRFLPYFRKDFFKWWIPTRRSSYGSVDVNLCTEFQQNNLFLPFVIDHLLILILTSFF